MAKEFISLEKRAAEWGSPVGEEVRRCLDSASKYLNADKEGAYNIFVTHDTDQDGRLTLMQIGKLMTVRQGTTICAIPQYSNRLTSHFLQVSLHHDNVALLQCATQDLLRGQRAATRQLHYLLTHAHSCDIMKQGRFTFNEVLIAFR